MKSTLSLCSAVLLAAAPALAIPPEDFGFPSAPNDTILSLAFIHDGDDRTNVVAGAQYGYDSKSRPLLRSPRKSESLESSYPD